MAYKVDESCISCGACLGQCPVNAIKQGDDKVDIDPDSCLECGACAVSCPMEAIRQD